MKSSVMYRVKMLIELLKAHGIDRIVFSPGNRNVSVVYTAENDPYFTTYCITDERSAGFFALGLIEELHKPVAICCTSGTAVCNYVSAVSEAFYQQLPLLVITTDRHPYYLNQNEDQMIPQSDLLRPVTRLSVALPHEETEKDLWYSNRVINEAILELDHHGKGPVQINIPIEAHIADFEDAPEYQTRKIERHEQASEVIQDWKRKIGELEKAKKILVIYGQSAPISDELRQAISHFTQVYPCAVAVDQLSNFRAECTVETFTVSRFLSDDAFAALCPDLVITVNGNYVSYIRSLLKSNNKNFRHWLVNDSGKVADPFRSLTDVFECTPEYFFRALVEGKTATNETNPYLRAWKETESIQPVNSFPYSDLYAVRGLIESIPSGSLLHLGNSTSVRIAQHFCLADGVRVYCNRGTNGIDGSMSAFIGAACATENESYLLIGDLSFFYDMNAFFNRYLGRNLHIMLCNNSGATLFHFNIGQEKMPTINHITAAEHNSQAKGWAESCGFRYFGVSSQDEYDVALPEFIKADQCQPVLMEVFTSKEKDAEILHAYYDGNHTETTKDKLFSFAKKIFTK